MAETGIVDAKSKNSTNKQKVQATETQNSLKKTKKTKPQKCYTHAQKWHDCAYQPKASSGE